MDVEGPPLNAVYVHPGGLVVARAPAAMTTVLGSCVAVCLRDARGEAGGMIHYVLPQAGRNPLQRMRYANYAIPELVARVREAVTGAVELEAKVVGGASVLASSTGSPGRFGASNVEAARRLLAKEKGVVVKAQVVGGDFGRRVVFSLGDGALWVRDLGAEHGR